MKITPFISWSVLAAMCVLIFLAAPPLAPAHDVDSLPPSTDEAASATVVDLGVIEQGKEAVGQTLVLAPEDRSVRIRKITVSCSTCQAVLLDPHEIPAGGTADLQIIVTTGGEHGRLTRIVRVLFDDPNWPAQVFQVEADVVPLLLTEPRAVSFGDVVKGEGAEIQVTVRGGLVSEFGVVSLSTSHDWLTAADLEPLPGVSRETSPASDTPAEETEATDANVGARYRFKLRLRESAPAGRIAAAVFIETDVPGRDPFPVPVIGRVLPPIICEPETLALGPVAMGEQLSGSFTVRRLGGSPLQLTLVRSDDPRVSTEITTLIDGVSYRVDLKLNGEAPKGRVEATLQPVAQADDRELPSVRLFAYVRSK